MANRMLASKLISSFAEISPKPTPTLTTLIAGEGLSVTAGNITLVGCEGGINGFAGTTWTTSVNETSTVGIGVSNNIIGSTYNILDKNGESRIVFDYDPYADVTTLSTDDIIVSNKLVIGDSCTTNYNGLPMLEVYGLATFNDVISNFGEFSNEVTIGSDSTVYNTTPILVVKGKSKIFSLDIDSSLNVCDELSANRITAYNGINASGWSEVDNINIRGTLSINGINISESMKILAEPTMSVSVISDMMFKISELESKITILQEKIL